MVTFEMGYQIVKYEPEFKNQVIELQRYLWSHDIALNTAYLEWKHDRNPYLESPTIYLALCEGKVVGMRGVYGARWQVGDPPRTFFGPCFGDLVVHPEHRGRGLVAKITEAMVDDLADRQCEYAFSLSAGLITQLASLKIGWRRSGALGIAYWHPGRVTNRLRSLTRHARRALTRCIERWRPGLGASRVSGPRQPFRRLDRNSARGRGELSRHVAVERAPRPEAMAELVERIGADWRIRHVRDQEYFAWRFQNPRSSYRFLFWTDARLEGYLVLQAWAHRDQPTVRIVDWEATNPRTRADLLQAAIRWGQFDELAIWSATLPGEVVKLLESTGFSVSSGTESLGRAYRGGVRRPTLLVRALRPEMASADAWIIARRELLDLGNWDLRMIYSDAF